jgi:tRNA-splicing ligase RtcB
MSSNPLAQHVRFMPDCHKSSGCCVGFTDMIQKGIVPSYVGGDIGCGILSCNSGIRLREKKYERVEKIIRQCVPVGENVHNRPIIEDLERIYQASNVQLEQLKTMYDMGNFSYDNDYFEQLCAKIKCNRGHILNCLGTLGAGNHYFEVNVNAEGYAFFTVHSGSRFWASRCVIITRPGLKTNSNLTRTLFLKKQKSLKSSRKKIEKLPKKHCINKCCKK